MTKAEVMRSGAGTPAQIYNGGWRPSNWLGRGESHKAAGPLIYATTAATRCWRRSRRSGSAIHQERQCADFNDSGRHGGLAQGGPKLKEGTDSISGHNDDGGTPARFFYSSKAGPEDRWGSRHPTVKPVELLKWLVPLVTPPDGIFLDCFAGSGTAGVAALATGRHAILIEREESYVADIRARMAFYAGDERHSLASRNRNARPQPALPLLPDAAG